MINCLLWLKVTIDTGKHYWIILWISLIKSERGNKEVPHESLSVLQDIVNIDTNIMNCKRNYWTMKYWLYGLVE